MERTIRGWEWPCLAAIAGAFILLRTGLYTSPGLLLGWNSDAALFGLMARAMRDGSDVPVFFWGQFYLGTFTSLLTAALSNDIGPLTLRIAAALEVAAGTLLFWLGLRKAFGRAPAMLAALWLVAGPAFLFHFTIAPIGAEQLYLIAGLLFWYATRERFDWFVLGMLVGFGMWLHQGVVFLAAAIGLALLVERALTARRILFAAIGAAAGYVPAVVSLLREDVELYRRALIHWSVWAVLKNVYDTARSDLWLLVADESPMGFVAAILVLALAIHGLRRVPWSRERIVIVATIAFSAAFWTLTTYPYPGAVRYIVPVVPLLYGAAAAGLLKAPRPVAFVLAAIVTVCLFVPRIEQVRDVVAARSELYTNWPGSFDPRPTLAALRAEGYRVCYGEVWVAHKLEWLSEPTVRFVPVQSVHRTLRHSLGLIRQRGPKCYVDNEGHVSALNATEEARWASSVLVRARKAGL